MRLKPYDCINVYDNVPSCVTKHGQRDSVKNIKQFMETFREHVDFCFHDVRIDVVKSHLCNLKANKATRYDILSAKLLKMGSNILCNQICYLLNMSLTTCIFPSFVFKICGNISFSQEGKQSRCFKL